MATTAADHIRSFGIRCSVIYLLQSSLVPDHASPLIKAVGACLPGSRLVRGQFRPIQAQKVPELEGKSWYGQCPQSAPRKREKHQSEGFVSPCSFGRAKSGVRFPRHYSTRTLYGTEYLGRYLSTCPLPICPRSCPGQFQFPPYTIYYLT